MVWRDNIKVLESKTIVYTLIISAIMHMGILFTLSVFSVVNHNREMVLMVDLMFHEPEGNLLLREQSRSSTPHPNPLPQGERRNEGGPLSHNEESKNQWKTFSLEGGLSFPSMIPHIASSPLTGGDKGESIAEGEFGSINGPFFLKMIRPDYPRLARRLGREGKVVLRLFIDEQGKLLNVDVFEKAGYGFDEAAVKAVKESTFLPAKINGMSVSCRAILPVRFKLE